MQVTIGISPGSRHIGIAVINNSELITWRVHTFKGISSSSKQAAITSTLQKLFASYKIKAVTVKIPDVFPESVFFSQVLGIINILCEQKGKKAKYYTLSHIKRHHSSNEKVTKAALIAFLTNKYPELRREYKKEQQNRTRYYVRVFEAVAVGLCTGRGTYLPK